MRLDWATYSQIVNGLCRHHIPEWMQPDEQIYAFKRSPAAFGGWKEGREPGDRKLVWQLLQ